MQPSPEKRNACLNEVYGTRRLVYLPRGVLELDVDNSEEYRLASVAWQLVANKINQLLGQGNRLTVGDQDKPVVNFKDAEPDMPHFAGYFDSSTNRVVILREHINKPEDTIKIAVHEFLHYFSHIGRDYSEGIQTPIAKRNNVGFRRTFGLDIRAGKEGQLTSDYFLSFNEAVTEMLAIETYPDGYETYDDYRELINQVIDDVVVKGLGSNRGDVFVPWSRDEVKMYIYRCYLRGDLDGFSCLLQKTYEEYNLSEQQFGLMTHKNDLPSVVASRIRQNNPGTPPPPTQVALIVQQRLDAKKPSDYITDELMEEGINAKYGREYDEFIAKQGIKTTHRENIEGKVFEIDSQGLIIYRGELAAELFSYIRTALELMLNDRSSDKNTITKELDQLLFVRHGMSMLSTGFREFYVYKHAALDSIQR